MQQHPGAVVGLSALVGSGELLDPTTQLGEQRQVVERCDGVVPVLVGAGIGR